MNDQSSSRETRDDHEGGKSAEELHLQSQIIANMAEGAYLARTGDGIIVYCNPRFEKMFGYGQGELAGQHVSILNVPGDITPEETAERIIADLAKNGVWEGQVQNITKQGTTFWCYASVSKLKG